MIFDMGSHDADADAVPSDHALDRASITSFLGLLAPILAKHYPLVLEALFVVRSPADDGWLRRLTASLEPAVDPAHASVVPSGAQNTLSALSASVPLEAIPTFLGGTREVRGGCARKMGGGRASGMRGGACAERSRGPSRRRPATPRRCQRVASSSPNRPSTRSAATSHHGDSMQRCNTNRRRPTRSLDDRRRAARAAAQRRTTRRSSPRRRAPPPSRPCHLSSAARMPARGVHPPRRPTQPLRRGRRRRRTGGCRHHELDGGLGRALHPITSDIHSSDHRRITSGFSSHRASHLART